MTEAEWLTATEPEPLWNHLGRSADGRKLLLFACACARRIWHMLPTDAHREALVLLEGCVERTALRRDMRAASKRAAKAPVSPDHFREYMTPDNPTWMEAVDCARFAVEEVIRCFNDPYEAVVWGSFYSHDVFSFLGGDHAGEFAAQTDLFRDIFGNPFRPPANFDKNWRTADVTLLARGIYEERAFDRMPILADALQDAGCDTDDLLAHLRDPNAQHVRGCWALDLVLGKM
jgi:hypothetical protein